MTMTCDPYVLAHYAPADIATLPAGEMMDALVTVATGDEVDVQPDGVVRLLLYDPDPYTAALPDYSTNDARAIRALTLYRQRTNVLWSLHAPGIDGGFFAQVLGTESLMDRAYSAWGETAALALCRALLLHARALEGRRKV